jgi:hypothetical protein
MGRFLSPDPYTASGGPADPGSWNRYAYTRGDPVNRYDPTGLVDKKVLSADCITVGEDDFTQCIIEESGASSSASGGSIGGGAAGDTAIAKFQRLNSIQHSQAALAIKSLSSPCQMGLTADGINLSSVAQNAANTVYYSTLDSGDLTIGSIAPGADGASMTLKDYSSGANAVSLQTPSGTVLNTVILTYNYFYYIGAYDSNPAIGQNITLVHEALHTALNLNDIALALKLGVYYGTDSSAASTAISTFLDTCFH